MLSLIVRKSPAKAKIVRWNQTPCLLARFSTSAPPMVWQLDLEKLTNYTLTVEEREGNWDLGYTVPQGAFTLIAHFDDRMDAEYAYDVVQRALLRGSPMSLVSQGSSNNAGGRLFIKLLLLVIVIGALWGLISGSSSGLKQTVQSTEQILGSTPDMSSLMGGSEETAAPSAPKQIETGVPVAADDVLPKN